MEIITAILVFLAVISVLVVFHEFGHYTAARCCGVEVLRFSIGLGKPFWRRRFANGSTEWVICWLPLGGYVQMLESGLLRGSEQEQSKHLMFDKKPLWQRTVIVLAGPVFNLLLAVPLFALAMMVGMPSISATVADVLPDKPAWQAGLRSGDEIATVAGKPLREGLAQLNESLLQYALQGREQIAMTVRRQGRIVAKTLPLSELNLAEATRADGSIFLELGLVPQLPRQMAVVGEVLEDSPAAAAQLSDASFGLARGDRIVTVDGAECYLWHCLVDKVRQGEAELIELGLLRQGRWLLATVRPELSEEGIILIGLRPLPEQEKMLALQSTVKYPPLEALYIGLEKTVSFSLLTLRVLKSMVTGDISTKSLNGPV
ncbi:MAG: RIP metalloprotease RseP, partial [Candidatus Porifericomitaceae bacterium WSBS_2022_MAG_OTU9]